MRRLRRAQPWDTTSARGSTIVFFAVTIVVCLAFAVMVVDLGMILLSRIQLQNAADAGALAGASAVIYSQEIARQRAIAVTGLNRAWQDGLQPVVIGEDDVTFPSPTRCRVRTHRTRATGDALRTFFVGALDPLNDRLAQVTATAEAECFFVCATPCLKPWSVADRWNDTNGNGSYDYGETYTDSNQNGLWDAGEFYDDANGNGRRDADEPYDPETTGYLPWTDVGRRITLKLGDPHATITPGFFYAVNYPPLNDPSGAPRSGAAVYRSNIQTCPPYTIEVGDTLQVEPGNMVGPTVQGVQDLLALDVTAYWDADSYSVLGSAYPMSPRIVQIGFFDPRYTPQSGRNYVIISKLGAFFIESVSGNSDVTGVFIPLHLLGELCRPGNPGFLFSFRLVS